MYKLVKDYKTGNLLNIVLRVEDNCFISMLDDNTDYQAFLKYQAEGGKVYGADEKVPDGQAA